jgi:hypothetical protein
MLPTVAGSATRRGAAGLPAGVENATRGLARYLDAEAASGNAKDASGSIRDVGSMLFFFFYPARDNIFPAFFATIFS